jgi:hypothetical protein
MVFRCSPFCLKLLLGALICVGSVATASGDPDASREYPPVALRGYGTLSGTSTQWPLPAGPASILQIHCDDADKAKIVHAKYLSDLGLLPGVKEVASSGALMPHWEVGGSSAVFAAARLGTDVCVFQASAASDLPALLDNHFRGERRGLVFEPEVTVPMFLDRWDRYGYRFYYHPLERPRAERGTPMPPYDFKAGLDFAEKTNRSGVIFWDGELGNDFAAGQMKSPAWGWAMDGARARQLPAGINFLLNGALWLTNEYRDETAFKVPGYLGSWIEPGQVRPEQGSLSFSSGQGRDFILRAAQETVRRYHNYSNIISWEDPNGEMPFSPQSLLTDHGPTADAGYRKYLQETYRDVAAVSRRWYGDGARLKSWEDVHVPLLTHFRGDGPDAIDLAGAWRINYEPGADGKVYTAEELKQMRHKSVPTVPAPEEWFQPSFNDSAWPELHAPGDDVALFLPKRPAVFRRTFEIDDSTLKKSDHWWLYIWDMSTGRPAKMWAVLNGTKVGESAIFPIHWAAFEVTGKLQAGRNQISLRLPDGHLYYRIYLSPHPVLDYPNLGEQMNAEWVDFIEWLYASRVDVMRRSTEMIRQVDPNCQIIFHHPDGYADGVMEICEDFGAEFHCSGYMSAFFADPEVMLSRGSDLPSSLEPGGPAATVDDFKNQMGLNMSEGGQGIDYFRDLHDVLWNEPIRDYYTDHVGELHMVGKYHLPKAQVAMLIDNRMAAVTDYPWGADPNVLLKIGWWNWNVTAGLLETFPTDGLTCYDFERGNAAKYPVILDSNTTIMDDEMVGQIESYVRNGGVFITTAQTGRHSPTKQDSWPIERLTGYHVTHIDKITDTEILETQPVQPAPGQDIISGDDWNNGTETKPNGLSLEKVAPECQDLMRWKDGKTAVGMRPLGKGYIIEVGLKYNAAKSPDRWESAPKPEDALWAKLYTQLLDHFQIARIPATLSDPNGPVLWRRYVSNNGLYDVWTLWNRSRKDADKVTLQLARGLDPDSCIEIKNQPVPFPVTKTAAGSALQDIALGPEDLRVFITPHPQPVHAATDWFELQRNWWRGTARIRKELPPFHDDYSSSLTDGWTFHALTNTSDVKAMVAPGFDDSSWEKRSLGLWGIPDHADVKHGLLRRSFTVPKNWTAGKISLWVFNDTGGTIIDSGHAYLDGKFIPVDAGGGAALIQINPGDTLQAGTTHTLGIEALGTGSLVGVPAAAWLSYLPDPESALDLSGQWQNSDDYLTYEGTLTLPGVWKGVVARRSVHVDAKEAGKNVYIVVDGPAGAPDSEWGVVINNTWIGRTSNSTPCRWEINITPWIKFGGDNDIRLIGCPPSPRQNANVASVKLAFYPHGVSPP